MSPGPSRSAERENADVLHIRPPAPGGADYFTAPAMLGPGYLRQAENIRISDGRLSRRRGPAKIYRATSTCGSKTFGSTGKYARIPYASYLLIPYGGFALHFSVTTILANVVTQIIHGQDGADGTPPFDIYLDATNKLVVVINWDGGGTFTFTTGVLTDGGTQHCLLVYDAVTGQPYFFVNDVSITSADVAVLGKRPVQTVNMSWIVAAKKTAAAVVSLPFTGKIDSLTLWSLAGTKPSSGSPTYISTLRAHARRQWPNPLADDVIFNYDMDAAGAVMLDTSRHANHAVVTGTPTDTAEVALSSVPCNYVGSIDENDGSQTSIVGIAGKLLYERTQR